jgi:hypothetical protein
MAPDSEIVHFCILFGRGGGLLPERPSGALEFFRLFFCRALAEGAGPGRRAGRNPGAAAEAGPLGKRVATVGKTQFETTSIEKKRRNGHDPENP